MLINNLNILDEENDNDNENKKDLLSISELAEQILSSEDEYDDYDEDDEDESSFSNINDEEEIIDEEFTIDNDKKEAIEKANKLLNANNNIESEEITDEMLFGKYEIVYNDGNKIQEKYSKLIEDTKINEFKHEDAEITINKIKSDINKYENERDNIQKFLKHNDKEIKISEARSLIEACLFVLGTDGLNAYDIKKVTDLPLAIVNNILDEMTNYYAKNKNSGLLLVQYGNRYKFVTKSQHYNFISMVLNKKERKALSDSVLETLAIIAYNQPCTKSTIEKIRNRSCINAIERLKDLGLIEADERSEAIGKPWLYSVTQKFFDLYGIKSLSELPMINRDDKYYSDEVDVNANFINEINEE